MFAIFSTGGKQYKVAKGDILAVEKLEADKSVEFGEVLMVEGKAGAPYVAGAKVKAEVVEQTRADKIIVFKKKRRQNYRRKAGHRQHQTIIKITDIIAGA
jgi:large subunit ribosomal protein L21